MNKTQQILLATLGVLVLVIFILVMVAQQTREYGTEVTVEENEFQQILYLVEGSQNALLGGAISYFYPQQGFQGVTFFSDDYLIEGKLAKDIYTTSGVEGMAQTYANLLGSEISGVVVIPQKSIEALVEHIRPSLDVQRNVSFALQGVSWNFAKGVYTPTVEEGLAILSSKDTVGDVADLRRQYMLALYRGLGEMSKNPDKTLNRLLTKDLALHTITPDNMMWLMTQYRPTDLQIVGNMQNGEVWASRVATLLAAERGELVSFVSPDFSVPVIVLNGKGVDGAAGRTTAYLARSGFAMGEPGNATTNNNKNFLHKTTDIDYYGGESVKQTAMILGALVHTSDIEVSTQFTEPKIVITIGEDFNEQTYYAQASN